MALRKSPTVRTDKNEKMQFTFRLTRHKDGGFKGLWELAMLDGNGKLIEVIDDANALPYCVDNIQGVLENSGL
jgi:hypothetical protein